MEELASTDRDGAALRNVICRRCGLVYCDPRPESGEIRDYYQQSYRLDYKASYQPTMTHVYRAGKVAVERFRRLAPLLRPACRVLDFGAGAGETVYVLRAMGYEAGGFEPNEGYAAFASDALGLPVTCCLYQQACLPPESQDVVAMFHVLEHMESPVDALRHARQWLRADGRLWVEVPNVEAVCAWPRSRFHRAHLYSFNVATLELAGRAAGLRMIGSAVSSDSGTLSAVFSRSDTPCLPPDRISGNCSRIRDRFRRHTSLRHALSRFPYTRPLRKLAARIEERKATYGSRSPQQVLDRLVAPLRDGANFGRPATP